MKVPRYQHIILRGHCQDPLLSNPLKASAILPKKNLRTEIAKEQALIPNGILLGGPDQTIASNE
jgi:hypothetical protein